MAKATVIVNSITYAMKGQQILESKGFKAHIDRDVEAYGKYGCGYCIQISGDCKRAVELLEQKKIKIKDVITE